MHQGTFNMASSLLMVLRALAGDVYIKHARSMMTSAHVCFVAAYVRNMYSQLGSGLASCPARKLFSKILYLERYLEQKWL
jgi:hypothetical protein